MRYSDYLKDLIGFSWYTAFTTNSGVDKTFHSTNLLERYAVCEVSRVFHGLNPTANEGQSWNDVLVMH